MLEATKKYCKCIKECSPEGLIAHQYTRYLGDLSGGQILKKRAQKFYKLSADGKGVQFYEFDQIKDKRAFKHMYRKHLDELCLDPKVATLVVKEAVRSFDFNTELFMELDTKLGLKPKPKSINLNKSECPFGFLPANEKNVAKKINIKKMLYANIHVLFVVLAIVYGMWRLSDI